MANPTKQDSILAGKNGSPLLGAQQALIADATTAHSMTDADASLGATTQAELEGLLDALGTKINAVIDVLEAHGLMKDS